MERFSERSSRDSSNNVDKVKEPWRSQSYALGGGEPFSSCLLGGFSWPPRTYTCTFCKREFRSAQALGGHMNVHRRDRARLRQSPPWDPQLDDPRPDLNLIPSLCSNPNPNPRTHLVPNLNMSPPCHANGKISSNGIPHLTSSPTSHASGAKFSTIAFPSLVSPLQCFSSASSSVSSAEPSGPKVDILRSTAQAVKYLFRREEELESLRDEEGRSHEQALVGRQVMRLDMEMEEGLDLELRLGHS